ncbi:MAG: ZIP family metal transporter [Bacteroidales bacterium]|jgi:zinc and cadmium transporter
MITIWIGTLVSVSFVSLVSLTGVFFISLKPDKLKRLQLVLVGLATGGLLGGAFFHLLPESFESHTNLQVPSLLILLGFIFFFVLERFLHWHHDHSTRYANHKIQPFGPINLIADVFHNFLDGLLIASAFSYNTEIGIATTLTVLLHELPQEIGDFGVLTHAGYSTRRALFFNFLSACTAYIGAFVILLFGQSTETLSKAILPFAAGGFIYLAAADLVPELHTEKTPKRSLIQLLALLSGIGFLYLILIIDK